MILQECFINLRLVNCLESLLISNREIHRRSLSQPEEAAVLASLIAFCNDLTKARRCPEEGEAVTLQTPAVYN